MSDYADSIIRFEEQNWDWLFQKFIDLPKIRDDWEQFVEDEFNKAMPDEDVLRDDR